MATKGVFNAETTFILVANPGPFPVVLDANTPLGSLSRLNHTTEVAQCGHILADTRTDRAVTTCLAGDAVTMDNDDPFIDGMDREDAGSYRPEVNKEDVHQVAGFNYGAHLGEEERRRLASVIERHSGAFTDGPPGKVTSMTVKIPTTDDSKLRPFSLRPMAPAKAEAEDAAIRQLLDWGVIEKSSSRLGYPLVMVKQGEKWRMCVDYRNLNEWTQPDHYPMQRSDDVFSSLGGASVFSSLDAARGYHQFEVDEGDRWKTAFISRHGLFQYRRMPFGLRNAPAVFQRFMDGVLGNLRWRCALVYIDDVIVYTKTFAEHLAALDQILGTAAKLGLRFAVAKCFFGFKSLRLLGRLISPDGLAILVDRAQGVREMAEPRTLAELYTFLGCAGYYRPFICKFAHIMEPLSSMTKGYSYTKTAKGYQMLSPDGSVAPNKSTIQVRLNDDQRSAFNKLKSALASPPVLSFPDYSKPFIIYVDSSYVGCRRDHHPSPAQRQGERGGHGGFELDVPRQQGRNSGS